MQKFRKVLGIVIAVVMVMIILPSVALATEALYEDQDGRPYPTLEAAIEANATTIKLISDVGDITINGTETDIDITLDLNGHKITELTILDSTVNIMNTRSTGDIGVLNCAYISKKQSTVTIDSCTVSVVNNGYYIDNGTGYDILISGANVIIKNDTKVETMWNMIPTNVSIIDNTVVTIEGGTVTEFYNGNNIHMGGMVIIEDGTVGLENYKGGRAEISGGEFEYIYNWGKMNISNAEYVKYLENTTFYSLPNEITSLTISGGTFETLNNGEMSMVSLSGGTVTTLNNGFEAYYPRYIHYKGGDVFMSDGTVTTLNNGESGETYGGNITISGGKVTSMYNYPAAASQKVTIEGDYINMLYNYCNNITIPCDRTTAIECGENDISFSHKYTTTYEWSGNYTQCTVNSKCVNAQCHVAVTETTLAIT